MIIDYFDEINESLRTLENKLISITESEITKEIKDEIYEEGYVEGCKCTRNKLIKELEYEPNRWVPCNVRKYPPQDGLYLVTIKAPEIGIETGVAHFIDGEWPQLKSFEVLAWDTMPSPYKGTSL